MMMSFSKRVGPLYPVLILILLAAWTVSVQADNGPLHQVKIRLAVGGTSGGSNADFDFPFCCGGTLGALVESNSTKYWLSNNHVLAGDGKFPTGDASIQPGLIDVGCNQGTGNVVGNLSDYVPYDFSGTNTVDAAIAEIVVSEVDTDGTVLEVGVPSTDPLAASVVSKK